MTTYHSVDIELIERRFDKPLGGSGGMGVDVITATVTDSAGVAGLGFTYVIGGGGALIATLAEALAERFLTGHEIGAPAETWATIQKSFNRTGDGPNVLALGALDVANWDLKAKQENVPLAVAVEGTVTDVPVYASGGFSPAASPEEMAEHALKRLEEGYRAIKPRVNAVPEDAQVIEAVRRAVGDDVDIMVDANEKGTVETASGAAEAKGVPIIDDFAFAHRRQDMKDTRTIGEGRVVHQPLSMLAARGKRRPTIQKVTAVSRREGAFFINGFPGCRVAT